MCTHWAEPIQEFEMTRKETTGVLTTTHQKDQPRKTAADDDRNNVKKK